MSLNTHKHPKRSNHLGGIMNQSMHVAYPVVSSKRDGKKTLLLKAGTPNLNIIPEK